MVRHIPRSSPTTKLIRDHVEASSAASEDIESITNRRDKPYETIGGIAGRYDEKHREETSTSDSSK
jgi:hypothetical protein